MSDHGDRRSNIAERMAVEGVPVKAICRALQLDFSSVWGILKYAVEQGRLTHMPANDWPIRDNIETREPTVSRTFVQDEDKVRHIMVRFRLTTKEAMLLNLLHHRHDISRTTLFHLLYPKGSDADPKIVDVFVCKIRRKLAETGIEFKTIWGRGYYMDADNRKRLSEALYLKEAA